MAKLNAEVKFGELAMARLKDEGLFAPASQPYSYVGTNHQLRSYFRMALLPKPFTDALDAAETVVKEQAARRGVKGFLADCYAIAGMAMSNGQHRLALMENSKPVEGYPDAVVTVKRFSP